MNSKLSFARFGFPVLAIMAALAVSGSARAASYYWTGNSSGGSTWTATTGGTNWSTDPNTPTDPGIFSPATTDSIFFVLSPIKNPTTTLGANFSVQGLTFTSDATATVTIGGTNTLTLGTGGMTMSTNSANASHIVSTNVALNGNQTWANNAPSALTLTFSGQISGSSALALQGTGSATTSSGAFIFSGANTLTSPITLFNNFASLTLNGGGTLLSVPNFILNGGSSLTLDNSAQAMTRLA